MVKRLSIAAIILLMVLGLILMLGSETTGERGADKPADEVAGAGEHLAEPDGSKPDERHDKPSQERLHSEPMDGEDPAEEAEPIDWHAIDDVDALRERLIARYEQGDALAAYQLHELGMTCTRALSGTDTLKEQLNAEVDPERRQHYREELDRLEAMHDPCLEDLRGENPAQNVYEAYEWLWRSADLGHDEAMYRAVFEVTSVRVLPDEWEVEDDEDLKALRQEMIRRMRDDCHAPALSSMGIHMGRGSGVTRGLELGEFEDVSDDVARQMEGFAHRYAAAVIEGESRPAHQARGVGHNLTAEEEQRAVALADDILHNCQ